MVSVVVSVCAYRGACVWSCMACGVSSLAYVSVCRVSVCASCVCV